MRTPLWSRGEDVCTWQNLNNSANIDRIDMKLVPKVAQEKVQFDEKTGKLARHTPFSEFSKNESSCDIDFGQNRAKWPKSAEIRQNWPKMAILRVHYAGPNWCGNAISDEYESHLRRFEPVFERFSS